MATSLTHHLTCERGGTVDYTLDCGFLERQFKTRLDLQVFTTFFNVLSLTYFSAAKLFAISTNLTPHIMES